MNRFFALLRPAGWLWPILLFLILPLLAFPEIVFGGQTLYLSDTTWIYYPGHIFMAAEWLAGRVPLWDPFRQAGMPMLAEPQIGVLYPFRAIFLSPLSPSLELSLFILMHFSLAAGFTWLLGREVGLSRAGAAIAGLSFGLGGVLMAQVPNLNIMTTVVWLPLVLYAALKATHRRDWLTAMLAGIPVTLQILAVHTQIVFYTLLTVAAYGLYQIITDFWFGAAPARRNPAYALRTGLLLTVMAATGLLLSLPQLLPSIEMLPFTTRAESQQGFKLLVENSLPPFMWLNLLEASVFGNLATHFKIGDPFQEDFIYAGFLPLLLAILALLTLWQQQDRRRKYLTLFFGLLLMGGMLMAMGRYTPLYAYVIQYLPGFSLFRIPARWLMVVNLAIAILAGFGLDRLLTGPLPRRRLLGLILLAGLLWLGQATLWVYRAELLAWADNFDDRSARLLANHLNYALVTDPVYQDRLLLRRLTFLTTPALWAMLNIGLALLLLTLALAKRFPARLLAGLAVLLVSLDMVLAGGTTVHPIQPVSWWEQLAGGAAYALENSDSQYRIFPLGVSAEADSISYLGQYYPSMHRLHSAGGYATPSRLARYTTFLSEANPVRGLQLLSVRHLLTPGQMGADVAATLPLAYQDEKSYVYQLPDELALPRAFAVPQALTAASPAETMTALNDGALDLRQTVILEPEAGQSPPLTPPPPAVWAGPVVIIHEDPQHLELEATLPNDGYVVLLDTYYPGWEASVDGQNAPIYRANYLGRAVFVPAGTHVIRFDYRPLSFRVGVWLGLATLLVIIGAAIIARQRQATP